MTETSRALLRPRKPWGLCQAPVCPPNVATHKTRYCDIHHAEFVAARKRFNDMKYNFRVGRTSRKPPEWADFLREIRFTPVSVVRQGLDFRARTVLQGVLEEATRCESILKEDSTSVSRLQGSIGRIQGILRLLLSDDYVDHYSLDDHYSS